MREREEMGERKGALKAKSYTLPSLRLKQNRNSSGKREELSEKKVVQKSQLNVKEFLKSLLSLSLNQNRISSGKREEMR